MREIGEYRIALYIRLSVEDSRTRSLSIENQKHALHRLVDGMENVRNIEVLEYIDNGYSGTNFERPSVQALLDDVRAGKIHCIAVKDFTRFGRNSIEVGYFLERVFPLYGVRFISVNDNFDSDTLHGDTGGVNAAFRYLAAEFYSRDLSAKVKSAVYTKSCRGEYQTKIAPYGYQKSDDGRLEPDEKTAPIVRLIFELAESGKTLTEIVKRLLKEKIPTPSQYMAANGRPYFDISHCRGIWSTKTLYRVLNDERYTGTYVAGKWSRKGIGCHQSQKKDESEWIKIPDHHLAIVSKEVFARVQTRFHKVKRVVENGPRYPLRGKVFCGCCSHALTRTETKNHSFFCRYTKVDETAACHEMKISEAKLEELIYQVIEKQAQIILNVSALSDVGQIDIHVAEQTEYERRIECCMEQKRILYERLVLREINLEDYKSQKAGIDADLSHWKSIYTTLAARINQMRMDATAQSKRLELALEITSADGLTAALVEKLIAQVKVYPGNQLEIDWKIKDFLI